MALIQGHSFWSAEVEWNLGEKVCSFIDSAVRIFARFMTPILEVFQVKL